MFYSKIVLGILCSMVLSGCVSRSTGRKAAVDPKASPAVQMADRDGDGIADADDKCPDAAETVNAYKDQDGCPDVDPAKVKLDGAVVFELNSTQILDVSDGIITQVAGLMRSYPTWKVRIEGHTDTYGMPEYNLDLSKRRAESVKKRLVGKFGIGEPRISTAGFGGTRPIASLQTREGRMANRRIDFIFIEE